MTLSTSGSRCIVPFLRGYGQTRFLSQETPRSGEQAALGADLLALMDRLSIEKAILGGYDWAGGAACIVAALWPERGLGLASAGATYSSQDIVGAVNPGSPDREARDWYQYYFHTDRGRKGLTREPVDNFSHEIVELLEKSLGVFRMFGRPLKWRFRRVRYWRTHRLSHAPRSRRFERLRHRCKVAAKSPASKSCPSDMAFRSSNANTCSHR
jgi:pimeloyl-ACP methyl ester carboxylesterase